MVRYKKETQQGLSVVRACSEQNTYLHCAAHAKQERHVDLSIHVHATKLQLNQMQTWRQR